MTLLRIFLLFFSSGSGAFERSLSNGVALAKLANFFSPSVFNIFDDDQSRFRSHGLHFRHTDNINRFLEAAKAVGLPEVRRLQSLVKSSVDR